MLETEISRQPTNEVLFVTAVQIYLKRGLFTNAMTIIDRQLQAAPEDPTWLFGKGLASLQVKKYDDAIAALTSLLSIQPTNNDALFNRAVAYLQSGRLDARAPTTRPCTSPSPTLCKSPTASAKSPGANTRPTRPSRTTKSIWPVPTPTPPRPRTSFKGCANSRDSHTERAMRVTHVITRLVVGGAQENTVASVLGLRTKPGVEVKLISGPTTGAEGSLESQFKNRRSFSPSFPNSSDQFIRPRIF